MFVSRVETYKCDGCGKTAEDPVGWSRLDPMRIGSCDFREDVFHYCNACAHRIANFFKSKVPA